MKGFPGSGGIKTNECQQNPGSGKAFRGHFIVPKSPNLYVYVPLLFLIMNASRAHGKSAPCHEGTNVSSVRPCPVEIWRYDSAHHAPHLRLRVRDLLATVLCICDNHQTELTTYSKQQVRAMAIEKGSTRNLPKDRHIVQHVESQRESRKKSNKKG